MPLLSIITPVYRTGDLLRRCLQSICEITLQDWECIVVNDGTDDGSFEIAKELAEKDSRFVLIDNSENHGVSYARNQALDIAKLQNAPKAVESLDIENYDGVAEDIYWSNKFAEQEREQEARAYANMKW